MDNVQRFNRLARFGGMALASCVSALADKPKQIDVEVSAGRSALINAPVIVALPDTVSLYTGDGHFVLQSGSDTIPAQVFYQEGRAFLAFIVNALSAQERRAYRLFWQANSSESQSGVEINESQKGVEVLFIQPNPSTKKRERHLFTRYLTPSLPNKPFFYPILTPEGSHFTRQWPLEEIATDTHDHPHHRGLWFTHGEVNGVDFWSEQKAFGKTVHTLTKNPVSGSVFGGFQASTAWITPKGEHIAHDERTIRIFPLSNGDTLFDFDITLTANKVDLVMGDTKEGMFGLRLPDTLAPSKKLGGSMINSRGQKLAALWGKPAEWVDYFGTIGGKTYGVAMLDGAANLRHPQTWHARDYGLFAINPFGLHDFGLGAKGAGDYVIPVGKSLSLKYRLVFHHGNTDEANIANHYTTYSEPPQVKVTVR